MEYYPPFLRLVPNFQLHDVPCEAYSSVPIKKISLFFGFLFVLPVLLTIYQRDVLIKIHFTVLRKILCIVKKDLPIIYTTELEADGGGFLIVLLFAKLIFFSKLDRIDPVLRNFHLFCQRFQGSSGLTST